MIASVAVAVVLVALTVLGPVLAIDRVLSERPWEHRALAVGVATLWQMVAVFEALTSAHAFTLAGVVATELLLCLFAVRTARPGIVERLARDRHSLRASIARTGVVTRIALAVATALAVLAGVRGLLLPPLGWDGLTYHLFHAARWIQSGTRAIETGPGAWGYYAYFPYVGDVPWAWAMLPFRGDAWVSLPAVVCLPMIALATFALARDLGAEHEGAWFAAALMVLCPAVLGYAEMSYVDNLLLFLWAAGSLFLGRYWTGAAREDLVLCVVALGLAAGVKPSGVPLLAVGAAIVGVRALSRRQGLAFAVGLAMAALCLRTYVVAWSDRGSPLWPMAVPWDPGDPEIVALLTTHDTVKLGVGAILVFVFLLREPVHHYFLNLGPVVAVSILVAVPQIVRAAVDPRVSRVLLGWILGSTAVVLGLVFKTQPTDWMFAVGRLITPLALTAAALAARRWRSSWGAWALLILAIPFAWQRGIRAVEWPSIAIALGFVAAAGAAAWMAPHRRAAAVVSGALGFTLLVFLARQHVSDRTHFYDAARAAQQPLFTGHPIDRELVLSEAWARLDDGPSYRVGYAAGWDGVGHNWLLYPALGTRLQNTVQWVAPTREGATASYRLGERFEADMDRTAWLARIRDLDLDWFLAAAPPPPEARWLEPPCFEPEVTSGTAVLFRVDQPCVRGLLGSAAP